MKGLFAPFLLLPTLLLAGCNLSLEDKEKLDNAASDLEKLADQIIITSPAKDSIVDQSMITVRADIPANADAKEVALYVDGIEIAKDTDGAPWEIQWPAYYSADGKPHTLLLKTITGSGNEVRNNEQFQVTVSENANQALTFSAGIDGTEIQDQNQLEVSFSAFPTASRYEVTDGSQIIETASTTATLSELATGSYALRYRAIFEYSASTTLTGPWSAPANIQVLAPELPVINDPVVAKNGSTYDIIFSWNAVSEADSYSVSLKKSSEDTAMIYQAGLASILTVDGLEMGMYSWSLIRTTDSGQNSATPLNEIGAGVFKRQFGGSADDYADHVIASQDGGFIVLGDTRSKGDSQGDDWIIKLDANGNTEWEYVLNKTGVSRLADIREFSDGSIYAFGANGNWQDAKGYLLKLSADADAEERLLWEVEYRAADADTEYFRSMTENSGRLFVASDERTCVTEGGSTRCTVSKSKLIEFDIEAGDYISEFELPALSDGSDLDGLGYLSTTSDGDFLLACSAMSQSPPEYYMGGGACLMKFDDSGVLDWSKTFVTGDQFLNGRFGLEAPWGDYILTGQSMWSDGTPIAMVSSIGSIVGTYTAGIDTYSNQRETTVFDDDENMLILLSGSSSDRPELWSTSRFGSSQKIKTFYELKYDYSYPRSIGRAVDGGLILLFNEAQSGYNNQDIVILKTDINGNM